MAKRVSKIWQPDGFRTAKAAIKAELDQPELRDDPSKRLSYILHQISDLESATNPKDQLRRYVLCVSALVHHEKRGGLSDRDVRKIATLAFSIIKAGGVKEGVTQSALLYSDLHVILSQIYRKRGKHWRAAWEHHLSCYASRVMRTGGDAFNAMISANRALRLGQAHLAMGEFESAMSGPLKSEDLLRSQLEKLRILRLWNQEAAFERARDSLLAKHSEEWIQIECQWERLCLSLQRNQNFTDMVNAVAIGRSHYSEGYVVEAVLWTLTSVHEEWRGRVPKVSALARRKDVHVQTKLGFFAEFVETVQECYDFDIPMMLRMTKLGEKLVHMGRLLTIDKELLAWAAAARFLAHAKSHALAALVIGEYRALSLKITDGENPDCLGQMQDLLGRYKNYRAA